MKKYIAVVLAACLALVCLCACSGKKTYDIQELLSAVEASAGLTDPVDLTEEDLNYDMGLTMENIDSFAGKTENVNGASGRVLVIKAVSGKGEDVKTELQSYVTSRAEFLGNYEEFAGAKGAGRTGPRGRERRLCDSRDGQRRHGLCRCGRGH